MRLRFTIRDLLWLAVVVALATEWFLDHRRLVIGLPWQRPDSGHSYLELDEPSPVGLSQSPASLSITGASSRETRVAPHTCTETILRLDDFLASAGMDYRTGQ
jgi:hypothetical protein